MAHTYSNYNSSSAEASYTYNGDGLRMSKTVDGVTTSHIWDGPNIVGDVTNGTVTTYIHGLQLISSKKGSNESFYTYNGHGDVVQITNGNGGITKQYNYDAFGVEIDKADNDTNPFRYCGEYYDTETDSVYLRARYYRPTTGRFITEDPIRDGLNWYVYCSNCPIMLIDPLGLFDYDTILSYDPGYYSDDVKVLQNELAWHGYLNDSDIDGYFGDNTFDAVNQYKYDNGLWNDGEYYGLVGLTTWQHLGLIYREQMDIDAGVQIMTIGAKQYFDISEAVKLAVIRATGEFQAHEGEFRWFRRMVGDSGAWNVKQSDEVWSQTLGISTKSYYYPKMFYGRPVKVDDIGNITYGYLGTAANFSARTLNAGSALNHFKNHGFGDWNNEQSDQACIALGILWYEGYDIQLRYGYGY